jgi:uncharacterized Fe-S center protein
MRGKSPVYYGSIIHGRPSPFASLAAKYDEIMERLDFSTIREKDKIAIKMHLGFRDGAQTVPVFYVRRLVKALKETGGYPFITDNPTAVYNAVERGYTQETCGCPIIPVSGLKDRYHYPAEIGYSSIGTLDMCGVLHDADALIDLSHIKGHETCGYAGAFKNLALGGYTGPDRWHKIHAIEDSVEWWDPGKCTPEHARALVENCPGKALEYNEEGHRLTNQWYKCYNGNCLECIKLDEGVGSLSLGPGNFAAFHELMAHSAKRILEMFDDDKMFYLSFLLDITPQCDCVGLIMPPVIPDLGIMGSRDIVAIEQATLDVLKGAGLDERMIPPHIKLVNLDPGADLHPFQRLWGPWKDPYLVTEQGERLGMGSRDYELREILPPVETAEMQLPEREYEAQATFF